MVPVTKQAAVSGISGVIGMFLIYIFLQNFP